jgi:hypothetical protein
MDRLALTDARRIAYPAGAFEMLRTAAADPRSPQRKPTPGQCAQNSFGSASTCDAAVSK